MTETVLVTGGTGFVGGWQIVELLRRGYAVRATVRSLSKEASVRAAVATEVEPSDRLSFAVADLMRDDGWDAAVAGCDYVLHVASPLGGAPGTDDALIAAARDGTLRVLRAAVRAKVKRVVMTSSTAACSPPLRSPSSTGNDETRWTDIDVGPLTGYRRSKILAERAAWDFMRAEGGTTELVTVLPTAIFGPILTSESMSSVAIIQRFLNGKMAAIPRLGFSVIDVRDLAVAQVLAMTTPAAAGERFIACNEFMWFEDVARTLRERLGDRAAKVPTKRMPSVVMRAAAVMNPGLRGLIPTLGRGHAYTSAKAQRLLGWTPRPAADTLVDCAESLIVRNAA
jgi:nucleoside-diphosphate-sugar epimerase